MQAPAPWPSPSWTLTSAATQLCTWPGRWAARCLWLQAMLLGSSSASHKREREAAAALLQCSTLSRWYRVVEWHGFIFWSLLASQQLTHGRQMKQASKQAAASSYLVEALDPAQMWFCVSNAPIRPCCRGSSALSAELKLQQLPPRGGDTPPKYPTRSHPELTRARPRLPLLIVIDRAVKMQTCCDSGPTIDAQPSLVPDHIRPSEL